jgi:hypothetical protein
MPNDWLASARIAVLSAAEVGGLFLLTCYAWDDSDCCLKKDEDALARLSRLGAAWNEGSGAKILTLFDDDPKRPGFIFYEPQRAARREQIARVKKSREQRVNAANSRWSGRNATASGSKPGRNATASIPQCESHASSPVTPLPSPITQSQEKSKKRPSLEEIKLFCAKNGIPEPDAEWFFHKCQGNGWTNAGKPIKSWTATLLSWKAASYLPSQKQQSHKPTKPDHGKGFFAGTQFEDKKP